MTAYQRQEPSLAQRVTEFNNLYAETIVVATRGLDEAVKLGFINTSSGAHGGSYIRQMSWFLNSREPTDANLYSSVANTDIETVIHGCLGSLRAATNKHPDFIALSQGYIALDHLYKEWASGEDRWTCYIYQLVKDKQNHLEQKRQRADLAKQREDTLTRDKAHQKQFAPARRTLRNVLKSREARI